ncbi:MAG: glycosyltransferase family 9 protein, partial [candidate division Zixibacteria bacterium]|nr:glycosyltransferase family 9 protein [candidate division Zixibacteria bacterium]
GTDLELWISPEDEGLANGFIQRHALEKFAIMHPGGSTVKERGLSVEGFIGLGKEIKKSFGLDCIAMGGVEEEEKIKRICSSDGNVFHDASGLPLLVSAQLIKHAAVFIGNDSGPSHIADALGTPGIIFYFESGEKLKQHLTKWKPRGDNYISVELSGSDDEIIRKSLTEIVRLIK